MRWHHSADSGSTGCNFDVCKESYQEGNTLEIYRTIYEWDDYDHLMSWYPDLPNNLRYSVCSLAVSMHKSISHAGWGRCRKQCCEVTKNRFSDFVFARQRQCVCILMLLNDFLNAFDAMQCQIPKRAFTTVFFLAATRDTPIQVPTEIVVTAWNVRQRSFCTWTCAIQQGFAKHCIFLCLSFIASCCRSQAYYASNIMPSVMGNLKCNVCWREIGNWMSCRKCNNQV